MSEELAFAECDRLVREFEQVVKKAGKEALFHLLYRRGSGNSLCGFSCSG